jgi:L-fuculose-phosphate aldolase
VDLRDELIKAVSVLGDAGCLPATDGNFSVRIDKASVWLTRSGIEKRELLRADLLEVAIGDPPPPQASSEWPLHRIVYQERREVNCILHVHSPGLTAFAVAHRIPDISLLAETALTIGEIALVPYAKPGTDEVGESLLDTSKTATIYLLSNHGALAVGSTITEALHRLERAEFLAKTELAARALGELRQLTRDQISELTGA